MSFLFRCAKYPATLPVIAAIALACGATHSSAQTATATATAAAQPADQPQAVDARKAADDARAARLRAETAQLNALAAQLQQSLDKSGRDKLSLDVIHLSEQVQTLARQIELELKTP